MERVRRAKGLSRDRARTELLGLDFGSSGVKAVRLRRTKDAIALVAADILPRRELAPPAKGGFVLPPPLAYNYAAMAFGTARTTLRLLDLPVTAGLKIEEQIQQQFNLSGDFRLAHYPVTPPGMKGTVRTVAVALPEDETQALLEWFAAGAPAPFSLEQSGLAALGAFQHGAGAAHAEEAVGLMDAGAQFTHLFLIHQDRPVLIRRFDIGGDAVVERIRAQFDLDAATAVNVLSTGAIDLSAVYRETMATLFKQLVISRDFVERRERCHVVRLYLTGGLSASAFWSNTLAEVTGLPTVVWNPLESLHVAAGALPEGLRGQETRFAAAVGAALGGILPP